jgi:putative hydrolase of the HAD superfamily
MPSPIPSEVRAIVFDAVNTLIHPEPPAAIAYARAGRRFGSRLDTANVAARFAAAFRRQEAIDIAAGLRTSEAREVARWRAIVSEVLDDASDPEACFQHLYDHFAQPFAWRVDAEAVRTISALAARGYRLAIASNFDSRLTGVLVAGKLNRIPVLISAAIGWRKPAREFFDATCQVVDAAPQQVLYVGDDVDNDYEGARAAGMAAILLDRNNRAPSGIARLSRLEELLMADNLR